MAVKTNTVSFVFPAGGPAETRPSTLLDLAQALGLSAGQRGPEGTGTGRVSGLINVRL